MEDYTIIDFSANHLHSTANSTSLKGLQVKKRHLSMWPFFKGCTSRWLGGSGAKAFSFTNVNDYCFRCSNIGSQKHP